VQGLLRARLVDKLRIDIMPVLFGSGLHLLENVEPVQLEKSGVQEVGARTSLRVRVEGR
jgi:dihydrofolate reductase